MILDNFPKVLWINLERSKDRRQYMEKLLSSYHLENHRISAVDGFNSHNFEMIEMCILNPQRSRGENACTCSHLKAIKYFLDEMKDDDVIIFEDDVSFEFLQFIPYNWSELVKKLPKNYQIIQLAVTREKGRVEPILVKVDPTMGYYSSVAYLITRQGAHMLWERYFSKQTLKIDLLNQKHVTADTMICSTGATYSIPIFSYLTTQSIIHPAHLFIHAKSKYMQVSMWRDVWKQHQLTRV